MCRQAVHLRLDRLVAQRAFRGRPMVIGMARGALSVHLQCDWRPMAVLAGKIRMGGVGEWQLADPRLVPDGEGERLRYPAGSREIRPGVTVRAGIGLG